MLKKLVIVYNSRSSKHEALEAEVLAPARKLKGWLVGKYEMLPTHVRDNAERLAKTLHDGDLVIVAGGDGTASVAVNGIMLSGKDVTLGVLGYGNFNDVARMLKAKQPVKYGDEYIGGVSEIVERFEAGKVKEIYPLEAVVDGEHWRYAPCYITLGMFAESTAVFDQVKVRGHLQDGRRHRIYSIGALAVWYFKNRKRGFLPEMELEQKSCSKKNSKKRVAKRENAEVWQDKKVDQATREREGLQKGGEEGSVCGIKKVVQEDVKKAESEEPLVEKKYIDIEKDSTESEKNSSALIEEETRLLVEPEVHFMRGAELKLGGAEVEEESESRQKNVVKNTEQQDEGLTISENMEKSTKKAGNVVEKTETCKSGKNVVKKTLIDKRSKRKTRRTFGKNGERFLRSKTYTKWQMAKVYEKVQQQANIRKSLWEERAQAKKEWEEVNRPTIIMPILEGRDSEAEVSSRGEMGEGKEKRESENGTHRGEKRQENVDRKPYTIGCEVENLMSHNQARAEYGVVARRVNATKFVVEKKVTDYMAVNSVRVAGMMRGRRFFRKPDKFLSVTARLGSFPRLVGFMLRSMLWYLPGKKVREDIIRFSEPSNVTIHAEGEHQRLNGVREIRVRKAKRGMKVVRF